MRKFEKTRLVSSKCIEFEPCRYNGLIISSKIVENLKNYTDFQPVCPEVEIGLGIPRDPVRIVEANGKTHLFQPNTGKKLTRKMNEFSDIFLKKLKDIDGFILKNRSPSCGIKNVKRYYGFDNQGSVRDAVGLFAMKVKQQYPQLPMEDEGRLRNLFLRENFLTKIFTLAEFRKIKNKGSFSDLIEFHSRNKFLLLSFNQENMKKMGRLLSSSKETLEFLKIEYEKLLKVTLSGNTQISSNTNVLMHSLGYFSKDISAREKAFFLDNLQRYREGHIPLIVMVNILKSWIIRFKVDYLDKQTFFEPYPEELIQVSFIYDRMN